MATDLLLSNFSRTLAAVQVWITSTPGLEIPISDHAGLVAVTTGNFAQPYRLYSSQCTGSYASPSSSNEQTKFTRHKPLGDSCVPCSLAFEKIRKKRARYRKMLELMSDPSSPAFSDWLLDLTDAQVAKLPNAVLVSLCTTLLHNSSYTNFVSNLSNISSAPVRKATVNTSKEPVNSATTVPSAVQSPVTNSINEEQSHAEPLKPPPRNLPRTIPERLQRYHQQLRSYSSSVPNSSTSTTNRGYLRANTQTQSMRDVPIIVTADVLSTPLTGLVNALLNEQQAPARTIGGSSRTVPNSRSYANDLSQQQQQRGVHSIGRTDSSGSNTNDVRSSSPYNRSLPELIPPPWITESVDQAVEAARTHGAQVHGNDSNAVENFMAVEYTSLLESMCSCARDIRNTTTTNNSILDPTDRMQLNLAADIMLRIAMAVDHRHIVSNTPVSEDTAEICTQLAFSLGRSKYERCCERWLHLLSYKTVRKRVSVLPWRNVDVASLREMSKVRNKLMFSEQVRGVPFQQAQRLLDVVLSQDDTALAKGVQAAVGNNQIYGYQTQTSLHRAYVEQCHLLHQQHKEESEEQSVARMASVEAFLATHLSLNAKTQLV